MTKPGGPRNRSREQAGILTGQREKRGSRDGQRSASPRKILSELLNC